MRIEVMEREASSGTYLTIVNSATRRHIATIGPKDNYFTSRRLVEAVNLYADLLDNGMLIPVLNALEKRKREQQK